MSHLILLLVLRSIDIADEKFLNLSTAVRGITSTATQRVAYSHRLGETISFQSLEITFSFTWPRPALASTNTKKLDEFGILKISYCKCKERQYYYY